MEKINILTVDDSPFVLKMISRTLRELGYEPITADTGEEGLRRVREGGITLVLTDYNMPEMNGVELVRSIRKITADIPIVLLTTEGDEALVQEAMAAGANGWIAKPPVPSIIKEYLDKLLLNAGASQTLARSSN